MWNETCLILILIFQNLYLLKWAKTVVKCEIEMRPSPPPSLMHCQICRAFLITIMYPDLTLYSVIVIFRKIIQNLWSRRPVMPSEKTLLLLQFLLYQYRSTDLYTDMAQVLWSWMSFLIPPAPPWSTGEWSGGRGPLKWDTPGLCTTTSQLRKCNRKQN